MAARLGSTQAARRQHAGSTEATESSKRRMERCQKVAAMRALLSTLALAWLAVPAAAGPCDILGAASPPTVCVAAHSTTRALYSAYHGPLYRVSRQTDQAERDVGVVAPGGAANATAQDAFCGGGGGCLIVRIYDQSPRGNHLDVAPKGGHVPFPDRAVNASQAPFTLGGRRVYAARFDGGMGYRNDNTSGVATGDAAETIYMVASGLHYNDRCCFDYGNAELDNNDDGQGTMEAVNIGTHNDRHSGVGEGPWILADLEAGMWAASGNPGHAKPIQHSFVTAMLKGGSASPGRHANGHYAIKGGNSEAGGLTVYYDGARPPGYSPMKKQGAIIMGIGGDNRYEQTSRVMYTERGVNPLLF